MEKQQFNIVYKSGIDRFEEVNASFDKGVLYVAYAGKNRNDSFISKETFEKCIKTIYNCPVVCRYDRESDSIGSHDVEIVKTGSGMRLVNLTQPVGLVPESAKYWWETVEEDDGRVHEYLCVEVLLWKRQEAYEKIRSNGVTSESMEIMVKSASTVDNVLYIDSFEFTAFCLLESAEPCYESACVKLFEFNDFRQQYHQMLADFKSSFSTALVDKVDINANENESLKGGNIPLDDNLNVIVNDIAESATGGTLPEEVTPFALSAEQFRERLWKAVESEQYVDPNYGSIMHAYLYVDYDSESCEVYCRDCRDWNLYGFSYAVNGDNVVVDFDSKKRKKIVYADYDDGESVQESNTQTYSITRFCEPIIAAATAKLTDEKAALEAKYSNVENTITDMQTELDTLREYFNNKQAEERRAELDKLFDSFHELDGIEAFESLREDSAGMTLDDIESKCFEIKGRAAALNFAAQKPAATRLAIEKNRLADEPYGGLFIKYPPKNK